VSEGRRAADPPGGSRQGEEREAERQAILDTMAQGLSAFDRDGRLLYRNAAARAILGIAADADIPSYVGAEHPLSPRRMDGSPIARDDHPVAHALRGRSVRGVDIRMRRLSGAGEFICRYDAEPLRDGRGAVSGAIVTFQDITEQVEAAAALQQREELLRLAQEAGGIGSFSWDVTRAQVAVSATFAAIYGRPEAPLDGPRIAWIDQVHPEDRALYDRLRAEAFERRETEFSGEFRILRPDGEQRWIGSRSRAYYDAEGRPVRVVGVQVDITGRKEAEAALRASEGRLRLALEFSRMGDWSWDAGSDLMSLSPRAAEILGLQPGARLTWSGLRELLHPDDRESARLAAERAVVEGGDYEVEYRVPQPGGAQTWAAAHGRARYGADGRILGMIGVVQDVSARKEAEERQNLLMAELDHRVKNVLAVVQAIAQQTLASDRKEVAEFSGRLAALSRAHDLLATRSWRGASLRALLEASLAPYAGAARRVTLGGDDLLLTPRAAQTLTLAFHELATNAAKYGALSERGGVLDVRWTPAPDDPSQLLLDWRESGGPALERPARRGFGSRLVAQSVEHELGGRIAVEVRPSGLVAQFELPLEGVVGPRRRARLSSAVATTAHDGRAAVHHEGLPGDPARLLGGQKDDGVADVPAGAFGAEHARFLAPLAPVRRHLAAGIDERRVHGTGRDAVDANAVRPVIDRHRGGQRNDRALGHRIGGEAARTQRRDRRDVHDGAAAALLHGRDGVPRHQEHRGDVHLHEMLPALEVVIEHRAGGDDADVVVEHVEPTPAIDRRLHQGGAFRLLGDVGRERRRLAALALDRLDRLLGQLLVAIDHQHAAAFARQQDGRGLAVADPALGRPAARDDGDLAVKPAVVLRHFPSSLDRARHGGPVLAAGSPEQPTRLRRTTHRATFAAGRG
jgi:PAS domain S-box-containing protein